MVIVGTMAAVASGIGAATYWQLLSLPAMWAGLLYHLVTVHGLSWAPLFGWLLFVSAFARRVPCLRRGPGAPLPTGTIRCHPGTDLTPW